MLGPLGLELEMIVCCLVVLGIEHATSGTAASVLNC